MRYSLGKPNPSNRNGREMGSKHSPTHLPIPGTCAAYSEREADRLLEQFKSGIGI